MKLDCFSIRFHKHWATNSAARKVDKQTIIVDWQSSFPSSFKCGRQFTKLRSASMYHHRPIEKFLPRSVLRQSWISNLSSKQPLHNSEIIRREKNWVKMFSPKLFLEICVSECVSVCARASFPTQNRRMFSLGWLTSSSSFQQNEISSRVTVAEKKENESYPNTVIELTQVQKDSFRTHPCLEQGEKKDGTKLIRTNRRRAGNDMLTCLQMNFHFRLVASLWDFWSPSKIEDIKYFWKKLNFK